ncbi:hypothetical protein ALI22I_04175 [Saccharothrix sp. ALI-22-I]|uniref:DUF2975 domain-containing protein n=1 Tax=Saccharothrix sp. ALI-22-I TaxID=1933778 RepID=UPI00097BCA9D|nr:DUF2975 domain-containing protein [Saccharothrix sp. ALI-22-I]ONI92454.1 hypothetical protein ALI22I_04175 [Saccharothrix sp. ALI-22-I]
MSKGNPLEPLTGVVSAAFALSAGVLGLATAIRLTVGLFDPVCFTAKYWPYGGESRGLVEGTRLDDVERARLCVDDPAPWQHVLSFLSEAPTALARVVALLLLLKLLRNASRHGIHTADTAAGVRRFGHYLLWVLPAAAMADSIARTTLVHAAVTFDAGYLSFLGEWEAPWWAVITGIALLSLAKIMRASAEMREELEGTV